MCARTIYPFVSHPGRKTQRATLKREICLFMEQINEDIFPSSENIRIHSLYQKTSVLANSILLELPLADVRLLISTVETVWF